MKDLIAKVSSERMEICEGCVFHSEVRKTKMVYKSVRPDVHCASCGCTLSAKTACLSCSCPLNKWEAVLNEEQQEHIENEINE